LKDLNCSENLLLISKVSTMVCPCRKDARGEKTKINYGMDTTGEKEKSTSKKNVDGRSTSSHDNKEFRVRSGEKQSGMAFGFGKKTTTVKTRIDRCTKSCLFISKTYSTVKQSHYRPGQALSVPVGSAAHIPRQSADEGGKAVSPKHRPSLPHSKYSWYSFLLETESIPRPQWGRNDYVNKKFQ
jgi:hypothetical protein